MNDDLSKNASSRPLPTSNRGFGKNKDDAKDGG